VSITENLEKVRNSISTACNRSGRHTDDVKLVAVSKFQPSEAIVQAIEEGQFSFGENRVQEACSKFTIITNIYPSVTLHLIGSLQRNKIKKIVPVVSCIESIDRVELLYDLEKTCALHNKKIEILFEYHTGEQTKQGFTSESDIFTAIDTLHNCPHLQCRGLMTMAPFTQDEKEIRTSFKKLRKLQQDCSQRYGNLDFSVLSMGMSNDFSIAIEEGSTELRIGTAIFGTV
jgi:PLP dependent protein